MATAGAGCCAFGEICDWLADNVSDLRFAANSGYRVESLLFRTDRLHGLSTPRGEPKPKLVESFFRTDCNFSYKVMRTTCGKCVILRTVIRVDLSVSADRNNLSGRRARPNKFSGGRKYVRRFDVEASSTKTE